MRPALLVAAAASAALAVNAHAAPETPRPQRPIVLTAARLFDGRSDRAVSPGRLVVEGTTIRAVGTGAPIPEQAVVIDLGDATLLPGFIDAHTHLTGEASDDWNRDMLDGLRKPVAELAILATRHARVTLNAGFTTVRDVGASDQIDVGLRNSIRDGVVPGPRMLVSAHAIGASGGHCDPTGGWREGLFTEPGSELGVANGPDAVRAAVRLAVKHGADVIKTCATGGVLSLTDDVDTPQLTQAELDALVDEAHALNRRAAAHAHGAEGAKRAIRAGIDSIEHGSFLDDEALDLMKARGTYLVPTLMALEGLRERLSRSTNMPPNVAEKARAAEARLEATFRRALAKGVKIALGTDAAVYPHGRNAEEFGRMVALGMKPADALRAGTSAAAELLGLSARTGSLEAGKIADVVAVPGDPTADVRLTEKVFFVMKEGAIARNDAPAR